MAEGGSDGGRRRLTRRDARRRTLPVALPLGARKVKIGEIREAGSRTSLRFAPAEPMPMSPMTS